MKGFVRLRDFAGGAGHDLEKSLLHVAADLKRGAVSGKVAVVVTDAERRLLMLHPAESRVERVTIARRELPETPAVVVYASAQTLGSILSGRESPLDAMLGGRLRYAGDEGVALAMLRTLAASQDAVFEPCRDPADWGRG